MSTAVETIRSLILSDATVSGTIGGRVSPTPLPERPVLPSITYTETGTDYINTLQRAADLRFTGVQVDVWSQSYSEAKTLASGIENALNDGRNTLVNRFSLYEQDSRLRHEVIEVRVPTVAY